MINNDLGKILFNKINELREESGGKIDINNIDAIIEQFVDIIKTHVSSEEDLKVFQEIEKISEQIQNTKKEISNVDPAKMSENFIPDATSELNSVTQATEQSTEIILENTENIQNLITTCQDEELKKNIFECCTRIFEACNFQDITGQRISKVTSTLAEIESSINALMKTFRPDEKLRENKDPKKPEDGLLSGPQSEDKAPTQDDIDDLFNKL